jgi:hypothetical protein
MHCILSDLKFCVEAIMEGKVEGEFRIRKNITDPGTASIFANYPAPYSSASIGLAEEVAYLSKLICLPLLFSIAKYLQLQLLN